MKKTRQIAACLCLCALLLLFSGCGKAGTRFQLDIPEAGLVIVRFDEGYEALYEKAAVQMIPCGGTKGEAIDLSYSSAGLQGFIAELPDGDYRVVCSLEGYDVPQPVIRIGNEPINYVNLSLYSQKEQETTQSSETENSSAQETNTELDNG